MLLAVIGDKIQQGDSKICLLTVKTILTTRYHLRFCMFSLEMEGNPRLTLPIMRRRYKRSKRPISIDESLKWKRERTRKCTQAGLMRSAEILITSRFHTFFHLVRVQLPEAIGSQNPTPQREMLLTHLHHLSSTRLDSHSQVLRSFALQCLGVLVVVAKEKDALDAHGCCHCV